MTDDSLVGQLGSDDPYLRAGAALKLGELKVAAAESELCALHEDPNKVVALSAQYATWQLGLKPTSIGFLMEALQSSDEEVMQLAVQITSTMGDSLLEYVPDLRVQSDRDFETVVGMLEEIGGDSARKLLKGMLIKVTPPEAALIEEALEDWEC